MSPGNLHMGNATESAKKMHNRKRDSGIHDASKADSVIDQN